MSEKTDHRLQVEKFDFAQILQVSYLWGTFFKSKRIRARTLGYLRTRVPLQNGRKIAPFGAQRTRRSTAYRKQLQTNRHCAKVDLPYGYPNSKSDDDYLPVGGRSPASLKCTTKIGHFQSHLPFGIQSQSRRPMRCEVAGHVHYRPGHSPHFPIHV